MKKLIPCVLIVAVLTLLIAGVAYIMVAGIPAPISRHYLGKLERAHDIRIDVRRIRWRPWKGFSARDVHLKTSDGALAAAFGYVDIDGMPDREAGSAGTTLRCRLIDGSVTFAGNPDEAPASVILTTCELARTSDTQTRFTVAGNLSDHWPVTLSGRILGAAPPPASDRPRSLGERLQEQAITAQRVLDRLRGWREEGLLPDSLNTRAMLEIHADKPSASRAWAFVESGPVSVHELAFDRASAAVRWTNGRLRIDSLSAGSSASPLRVEHMHGSYSNGIIHVESARVASDRPADSLPQAVRDAASRAGIDSLGPLRVDFSLGPAPVAAAVSNISGRLTCTSAQVRGTRFGQTAFTFQRVGDRVRISDATAILAAGELHRSLSGYGTVAPGSGYSVHVETDAEPRLLAPLLPRGVGELAMTLHVDGASHIVADIEGGAAGTAGNLVARGTVHATQVLRHEAAADLAHASFAYSNRTLRVEDLALVRSDGEVTGSCTYDFTSRLLAMDVRSSAPPIDVARFVGPGLTRVLAPYRFEGPVTVTGKGSIGLRDNPTRNLHVRVDGRQIGRQWFLAERAAFDLAINAQLIALQNISARWCGGDISGSLRVEKPAHSNAAGRCSMDLALVGADLEAVVGSLHDIEDGKTYEGVLSGQITLAGSADNHFLETAIGAGRADVQDGYILSLPLFWGLSKYLSMLVPGLGFANQRDARCSFRIRDGRLETDDAQLLGKVVSIRGKGSYSFNRDLSARVQVQFLKEGLTATVTRLLTSPLTKALEFELSGTTQDPRWRPVNTPDRLLTFFAENLGRLVPGKEGASP